LDEFLKNYGERGYTREPYYPRWNESPSLIIDIIKSLIIDNEPLINDEESRRISRRIQVEKLVESRVKSQILGMLKWKLFTIILKNSRKYICFRENQRFNLDRWITRHRQLFLKIGSTFTSQGLIDAPDKIFFFYKNEIRKIIEGGLNSNELKMLSVDINGREKDFKLNEDTIPPKFILNFREFDDLPQHAPNSTILSGTPASQGIVTASVRILKDIEEIPNIRRGEIIVVPRTDPGWTPAFSKIGGLITETGGVLSHGAVISREYDIPAVTNVQHASKILKSGQIIILNGFNGQIKIK
jgi:pyruvate,water dikinase